MEKNSTSEVGKKPAAKEAKLFGLLKLLLIICLILIVVAIALPWWSLWSSIHTDLGTSQTTGIGLWTWCTRVDSGDGLVICRNIDYSNWPIWNDALCVGYFTGTRACTLIAMGAWFVGLIVAAAALKSFLKDPTAAAVKGMVGFLVLCTVVAFATSLMAFIFYIVFAEHMCGSGTTDDAWTFTNPPSPLKRYSVCFILCCVACALGLVAMLVSGAILAGVSKKKPDTPMDGMVAAQYVPYQPYSQPTVLTSQPVIASNVQYIAAQNPPLVPSYPVVSNPAPVTTSYAAPEKSYPTATYMSPMTGIAPVTSPIYYY